MVKPIYFIGQTSTLFLFQKLTKRVGTFSNNATLVISKTSIYWQNLPTHTSSYLSMHLQIVDFDCRNYNVKCGYCKGIVTSICSLI